MYKDDFGTINNQWPGLIKIVVKNLKQVKVNVDNKHTHMKEQMNIIKEDLKKEIIGEVNE